MSPLVCGVVALAVGCVAGGALSISPAVAARAALAAMACLVIALRLAWAGHHRVSFAGAACGAAWLGLGIGALAEARAWQPPGIDADRLTQPVSPGELVRFSGVLRRDAWIGEAGDVAADVAVDRLWWQGAWRRTAVGVRVTVSGDAAVQAHTAWTRGRRIEAPVASLRRPLPYRNFDVPDAERTLARRGLRLFATVKSAALVEATAGPLWEEAAADARRHVRAAVARHVGDPVAAATVTAILIGDRSRLSPSLVRDLQHAGIYHVVAISGGNVGIWLALLVWLPRIAGAAVRAATAWLGLGLLGFAVVVDGGASVARAVTVAAVVIVARWWDVRASPAQALAVAALVQLLTEPLAVHDAGCVLSFGAAGTLVFVSSIVPRARARAASRWQAVSRVATVGLGAIAAATLAVELVLLPITARWFNIATAAGLLANLLAIPAMAVVQIAGLAVLVAAPIWPLAGDVTGVVAAAGVHVLMRSADVVSVAPWLVRDVPPPSNIVLASYYAALAGCCVGVHRWSSRGTFTSCEDTVSGRWSLLAAVAASAVVAAGSLTWIVTGGVERSAPAPWTWPAADRWQRESWPREAWLVVTMLDVGQGDATVVRFPAGRTWLVDAGGSLSEAFDVGARVTAPALWALGHRRLDRVIVSHGHPDHSGGMPAVIRRFAPRELLTAIPVRDDERPPPLAEAARLEGTRERSLAAGESLSVGPVHVSVRHPERADWERRRVRNDDSLVLWLRYGDVGILLPGDVGHGVEQRFSPRLASAPLTVLHLAHHGSASSSGDALLDALRPVLAIGSMGRGNRFGHPAPVVVRRLADRGIALLRTDLVGAIQLATNGRVLLVRTATGLQGSLIAGSTPRAWWPATPLPSDPGWRSLAQAPRQQAVLPPR